MLLICFPLRTPSAAAQIINITTLPLAKGDQFLFIPSTNQAMGGVAIALEDALLDPFINPVKGRKISGLRMVTSSTFYDIGGDDGRGRTYPISCLFSGREWFGDVFLAFQEIHPGGCLYPWYPDRLHDRLHRNVPEKTPVSPSSSTLQQKPLRNLYASIAVGKRIPTKGLSIGLRISVSDIRFIDGTDLLYAGHLNLSQRGNITNIQFGITGAIHPNLKWETLLIHNRVRLYHQLLYPVLDNGSYFPTVWLGEDLIYEYGSIPNYTADVDQAHNRDFSTMTGIHLGIVIPLRDQDWHLGGILTAQSHSHSAIPRYELESTTNEGLIPSIGSPERRRMKSPEQESSRSAAFNIGIGIARTGGRSVFGADLIFEPIWTVTQVIPGNRLFQSGITDSPDQPGTLKNTIKFCNSTVRLGIRRPIQPCGLEAGVQVRLVWYHLTLEGLNPRSGMDRREYWLELIPSWGGWIDFDRYTIRYVGRLTTGTGRPLNYLWIDPRNMGGHGANGDSAVAPAILFIPTTEFDLDGELVITHQISLVIPFGS